MRVAVVGAGLAGLAAADELAAAGIEPIVFEARDRVGGRVHSRELDNGAVIEMGAEFILAGCTEVLALAERLGLCLWDKGMRYGRRDPRGVEIAPGALDRAVAEIEDALAAGPASGLSVAGLLDRMDMDAGVREAIIARAEVSAGAPADLVPAAELAVLARVSDLPSPGVAGGNQRLATALAAAVGTSSVHLGAPVEKIAVGDPGVTVRAGVDEVLVDACIVAVPATVVESISFDPQLPAGVSDALASISYGHNAKLFIPMDRPAPVSATLSVPDRYWAWTASADRRESQPVISAFAGSSAALAALGVEGGPATWATKLVELRPDLELDPARALLSTWDDDPWVRASYSVETPPEAAACLSAGYGPIRFAGEHLGGEMSALMEGAIRSGRHAAASLA